ncbi:Ubiquinol oxidase subunit 2 [Candidatus Johnevansia muelleri]|uniref:Ubiquinol oxidase subunit 2 n=1 Tax=Candidatus Johnevansia muelleri TaxID=1495769 RepID=A0A078KHD0_9GAMM|nr:Ubiquinol oxidase subunit 2 [Candidatus Evansia muelleri]
MIKKFQLLIMGIIFICGCGIINPKGKVGIEQKYLILTSTFLMLLVVVPVIIMIFIFAWKYRASNKNAKYTPNWSHSNKLESVIWLIPIVIIFILGILTWNTTHDLDPKKPISNITPIRINVVALDWKWLFIYPKEQIAIINEIALPVNVPVEFHVTSSTVMNSFFIPQLGSQTYAMYGMQNILHLFPNEIGTYTGISSNYSGKGFSDMKFRVIINSNTDFKSWIKKVKQNSKLFDFNAYKKIYESSIKNPVEYFNSIEPNIFEKIIKSNLLK